MSRLRPVALAAALFVALLAPMRPATACSCIDRPLPELVGSASTVFLGTVESSDATTVTFDVARVFKGDSPGSNPIANGEATCAIPFTEGRRYVVFAALQNSVLATGLCSGTTNDLSIVSRLSVGTSPSPKAAPTRVVTVVTSRTLPIAAAAVMLGLVAVAALIAVRSTRRPRPIA